MSNLSGWVALVICGGRANGIGVAMCIKPLNMGGSYRHQRKYICRKDRGELFIGAGLRAEAYEHDVCS